MRPRIVASFASAVILAALAATPATAADETTGFLVDPQHSNAVAGSPLRPPLRLRWQANLGTPGSTVLVTGGRVTYVREPGTGPLLTSLDAATGRVLWEQKVVDGYSRVGLAADQGRLYVVSDLTPEHGSNGVLARRLDPATGRELWRREFGSEYGLGSEPTAADGQLFFLESSGSTSLHALRGSDGADLWEPKSITSGDESAPSLDAGTVYVSVAGPQTFAFDRATGAQRWHYRGCCTGGGGSTTRLNAGRLYAEDGLVHDAGDGRVVDSWTGAPSFESDGAGVDVGETGLRGFGPGLRTTRWATERGGSRPLLAGGHAYSSEGGGFDSAGRPQLLALRTSDGGEAWCTKVDLPPGSQDGGEVSAAAAGDGLLLVRVGYGLAAYESGGPPSSCEPATAPDPGDPSPGDPSTGGDAAPAISLRVGRTNLLLGERTNATGTVTGVVGAAGRRVTLEADAWPFDGRFRTVPGPDARVAADGSYALKLEPRRNVRLRVRLLGDPELRSGTLDLFADFPARVRRIDPGGRRPQLRYTVFAFPKAQIRRKKVYAYLARGRTAPYRRVDGRKWQQLTRRTATVRLRFPRGRLTRRDRYLICVPERSPDAFGRPTEVERRCGARTLDRALVTP